MHFHRLIVSLFICIVGPMANQYICVAGTSSLTALLNPDYRPFPPPNPRIPRTGSENATRPRLDRSVGTPVANDPPAALYAFAKTFAEVLDHPNLKVIHSFYLPEDL